MDDAITRRERIFSRKFIFAEEYFSIQMPKISLILTKFLENVYSGHKGGSTDGFGPIQFNELNLVIVANALSFDFAYFKAQYSVSNDWGKSKFSAQ